MRPSALTYFHYLCAALAPPRAARDAITACSNTKDYKTDIRNKKEVNNEKNSATINLPKFVAINKQTCAISVIDDYENKTA